MPSSPPIVYPELPKFTSASPPVSGSPVSARSRPDLSVLKRSRENAVLYNQTMHRRSSEHNCPAHGYHRKRPLDSSAFSHLNAIISSIKPPQLPHHERGLYEVYDDATDEEEDDVPHLERVQDERDVAQATTELEAMWREQMIQGDRQDPVWKVANDSTATAAGGKAQHYSIGKGLLYATPRGGEKCVYIPTRTCNKRRDSETVGYQRDTQQGSPQCSEKPSIRYRIPILSQDEKGLPRFRRAMRTVSDQ